jgi:hypothetical protein
MLEKYLKKINKKVRYAILSVLIAVLLVFTTAYITSEQILFYIMVGVVLMLFMGLLSMALMYESVSSPIYLVILLGHMITGSLAFLFYFPNLGPLIRFVAFVGVGVLVYTILLVNNVFVVTKERGGIIPLYTAALTWSQVMIIVISIPYYSGVFKITLSPAVHWSLVMLSSILFTFYIIWAVGFDPDTKRSSAAEKWVLSIALSFIVVVAAMATSFYPAEAFLRALFVSAVLMTNLAYVVGYYKNRLYARMFFEYGAIIGILFILLLIFNP